MDTSVITVDVGLLSRVKHPVRGIMTNRPTSQQPHYPPWAAGSPLTSSAAQRSNKKTEGKGKKRDLAWQRPPITKATRLTQPSITLMLVAMVIIAMARKSLHEHQERLRRSERSLCLYFQVRQTPAESASVHCQYYRGHWVCVTKLHTSWKYCKHAEQKSAFLQLGMDV